MTKNEFLRVLNSERKHWEDRWKGIDLFHNNIVSHKGEMNIRDVLYHVAWYEREMVDVLQMRALVGSAWWDLTQDERNANILAEGQSVSLLEAYHQEQQVYAELLRQLEGLKDEELEEARYFREMPPDWKPWEMLASNTYEHYQQHHQDIKNE